MTKPTAEDFAAVNKRHAGSSDDDAVAGEQYRLAHAQALLRMFREETGRPAETVDELSEWLKREQ